MSLKSRLALALIPLVASAVLLSGCAPAQAHPAAPKSGIYCKVEGKAASAAARSASKDFCKVSVNVRSVLSADLRERFDTKAKLSKAIPKGTHFTVHQNTFAPDGISGASMTIEAKYPKRKVKPYMAIMVHTKQGWKIQTTYSSVK